MKINRKHAYNNRRNVRIVKMRSDYVPNANQDTCGRNRRWKRFDLKPRPLGPDQKPNTSNADCFFEFSLSERTVTKAHVTCASERIQCAPSKLKTNASTCAFGLRWKRSLDAPKNACSETSTLVRYLYFQLLV